MSEMIERVARALFSRGRLPGGLDPGTWEAAPVELKQWLRGHARAAIEAMREPTDAMAHAGATDTTPRKATNSLDRMYESVGHIYRAMIDAALANARSDS